MQYRINNEISQAINTSPNLRLEVEKKYLLPLPAKNIIDSYTDKKKKYKVSKESMITYLGNKYSVPTSFIGKYIGVEIE